MSDILLHEGERIDDLQRAGLQIIQDTALFCFGMDAVLLSAYVQMKKAERGLDLCTGNGIIPILLSDRTDCRHLSGLEIQPASAELARRSVLLNDLQDRISIVEGDLCEAEHFFAPASFDFITCNPPYRAAGSGKVSGNGKTAGIGKAADRQEYDGRGQVTGRRENDRNGKTADRQENDGRGQMTGRRENDGIGKTACGGGKTGKDISNMDPRAVARHELLCSFEDVARTAQRLLRHNGHFYLVHRPLRLPELLITLCSHGLEPKRMRLVFPYADKAPNLVLLDCVRGGAPELRVEPPLIVYEKDGSYTHELKDIYYG